MLSRRAAHFSLVLFAGISLLAALWAGLARLGWDVPLPTWSLPAYHGPLMVVGFTGTLIGLERAAALKQFWGYGAPALSGLGAVALLVGLGWRWGHGLMIAASLLLIWIFVVAYRRHRTTSIATMGAGALSLLVGHLLWQEGQPLYHGGAIPWWVGFLVLTITGERLELSRFRGLHGRSKLGFFGAGVVFLLGLVVSVARFGPGVRIAGIGMTGFALWLLRFDVASLNLRQKGLARFMGLSLMAGYLWLAVGGLLWFLFAHIFFPGPEYDAMLHSIFLGFVLSMIFGHAPVIFPAVLGVQLPFRPAFYGHLCALHLSLLLRVGGALTGWIAAQRWGGLLNVLALLLFVGNNLRAALLASRGAPVRVR